MTLAVIIALLLAAVLLRQVLLISSAILKNRLKNLVSIRLQKDFFTHILQTDLATLGRIRPSGMMTHLKDVDKASNCIPKVFEAAVREPAKMIVCLAGAAMICWPLLLFTLVLAPIAGLIVRSLATAVRRISHHGFEINREIKRALFDVLSGLPMVQISTAEKVEQARFDGYMGKLFRRNMKMAFYESLSKSLTEVFGLGAVCVTLIAGAYLVVNQQTHIMGIWMCDEPLSIPLILVFYGFLMGMNDPMRRLGYIFTDIQRSTAAAIRLFSVLDQPLTIKDPEHPVPVPSPHRCLEFRDVHFQYHESTPVLTRINLRINTGETVVIVGSNGSGKSTLLNLLPRFYDPVTGSVKLDGIDLREFRLSDLRSRFGLVMQHPVLFDGTVRDNIAYGVPGPTHLQIVEAANLAQAHAFIEKELANGYETLVGANGDQLSGGQRQRISMARLFLRKPEIVILDEATSQVDRAGEMKMHQSLRNFLQERTTIIVSHRLSTLELADRIVVMNNGNIVSTGTHDQLMQQCSFYRQLRSMDAIRAA